MLRNLHNNSEIEVTIVSDIYDETETEDILLKKNAKRKETIFLDDVKTVGQVWNSKGKIEPNRTYLQHTDLGKIVILARYKEIRDLKFPKLTNKIKNIGYGK
jgi:hypothetical protein